MASFRILPIAEKIDVPTNEKTDDDPSHSNCPVRSFSNKYMSVIIFISCIIGFFGIFIKSYYLLGFTFGVPVITLGSAISPKSVKNDGSLSEGSVIIKFMLGEVGLFLMITCFSLLSSESGWRPLSPKFFIPSLIVLISTLLLYFLIAPAIRLNATIKRKKICSHKVTMYFTGYTRSSDDSDKPEDRGSNIYPQFVYYYCGIKYRVTDWEDKIMENGKVSSVDVYVDPDEPEKYYDPGRFNKRIIDYLITITSTFVIMILMLVAVIFIMNADLSAEKYIMTDDAQTTTEEAATEEVVTTEEVEDY